MKNATEILRPENWYQFKIYKKPNIDTIWKPELDWYHNVLREVVNPFVESTQEVNAVLFGIYGPRPYEQEKQDKYEVIITSPPKSNVIFIRLRICFDSDNKKTISNKLIEMLKSHHDLVWAYEILNEYKVRNDLGVRFGQKSDGSIDDHRTLRFIRYWDAGCRYILSILADKVNWDQNVDVWGIPHLINNSLGGWIRPRNVPCPKCKSPIYMSTGPTLIPHQLLSSLPKFRHVPIFLFACLECNILRLMPMNI